MQQPPLGPSVEVEPTSHHTSSPTGLDMTIKLPASEGVKVLEPAQLRFIRIDFPPGLAISTGSSDGLSTCSPAQVRVEEDAAAECPDAAKLASTEFDVPVLERNLKGAIYLREPEPGGTGRSSPACTSSCPATWKSTRRPARCTRSSWGRRSSKASRRRRCAK
jgi:hypothetical protein